MFNPRQGLVNSLGNHPQASVIADIITDAFDAVEPGRVVSNYLHNHPLPSGNKTYLFGLGKAACSMGQALSDKVDISDSLIITKYGSPLDIKPCTIIEGDHPIPGPGSLYGGKAAKKFLSKIKKDDLLICLISGGGSALMTAPRVPIEDLQILTSALLACGARIDEINTLRRHLDELKGGGVVAAANGARIISLLLSDVVGDSLEDIASGPTAPDPTSLDDVLSIIDKYKLTNSIPASIIPALQESIKPYNPIFDNVQNSIIASNSIALNVAKEKAESLGFKTIILNTELQGEARDVGKIIAGKLKDTLKEISRPFCLLAGGETTVTITGDGMGGRNQELVLSAIDELSGLENVTLLSIATDGEDGPTDAAGAYVTGASAKKAISIGLDLGNYRLRNDAYHFFERLGQLIRTGTSGTNVNDLVICFAFG